MSEAVREATGADLASLAELFEAAWPGGFDRATLEAHWRVPGTWALLLEVGGALVSGILLRRVLDEAEILMVASGRRRQGYARRLLAEARERLGADGVVRLHLEVAEDNPVAIALYESAGFEPVGRRPGYYRSGAAARLYAASLR